MKTEETLKKFGSNVRKARLKLGLTQKKLGLKSGLDSRHIGFIERGEINSTVKTISKISQGLNRPIYFLFRGI